MAKKKKDEINPATAAAAEAAAQTRPEESAPALPDGEKKESDGAAKNKKPKNKKARLLVALIVVVLIAATVLTVLNLRLFSDGTVIDDDWKTPSYLRSKTMNILVCGVAFATDDEEHQDMLTDVIMVVNFDMEANRATILQIPRDTYVGEDVVYTGKINALYSWGNLEEDYWDDIPEGTSFGKLPEPQTQGDVTALIETINNQFKLPIDHYVTISMEGFRKVVDIIGGVDITLDEELVMELAEPIEDENGEPVTTVVFPAGTTNLNGTMADLLVRHRFSYSQQDIQRVQVQRYFLAALMNKATSLSTSELVSLANAIYPYLETDFSIQELLSLAMEAKELSGDSVTAVRIPIEYVPRYGKFGLDVLSVHRADLADLLNEYMRPYSDPVPETELEVVEIQNKDDSLNDNGTSLDEYGA